MQAILSAFLFIMKEFFENFYELDVEFFFATNSICIDFYKEKNNLYYIWVDPDWRICKENNIIISSYNCPIITDFETDENYKNAFNKWCETLDYLKNKKIIKINLDNFNDINILWEDGSYLKTFKFRNNDDNIRIHDVKYSKIYIPLVNEIIIENDDSEI